MSTITLQKKKSKTKAQKTVVDIKLDQTPGRKYFSIPEKPTVVITKRIRVNRDALRGYDSSEKTFIVEIEDPSTKRVLTTVYLSHVEILGNCVFKSDKKKSVGCSFIPGSAWVETTAPLIGKRNGKPWGTS